jgi:RNA polymerase sigma-70 factor (ECF subfamily)
MKAYLHLNTFDGSARFVTWVTRIAINSSLTILRRRRSHPQTSLRVTVGDTWQRWDIADRPKNGEELYERHECVERMRRAICCLPPTLRILVEIMKTLTLAALALLSVAAALASVEGTWTGSTKSLPDDSYGIQCKYSNP